MCMCVSYSAVSDSLRHHGLQPSRLLCPWESPGQDTGVGCHSLPRRSARTQDSNLGLLHCRQILYLLSHQGSPFLPMCTVYSCAFLLISYMLDLCVSVWKTFLPDMSYVTGLLKASNELLCIKTLASSYRDRCYFFSLPLTIHCTKHFITLFHMILTVTYNVGNIRILLQTTELEQ